MELKLSNGNTIYVFEPLKTDEQEEKDEKLEEKELEKKEEEKKKPGRKKKEVQEQVETPIEEEQEEKEVIFYDVEPSKYNNYIFSNDEMNTREFVMQNGQLVEPDKTKPYSPIYVEKVCDEHDFKIRRKWDEKLAYIYLIMKEMEPRELISSKVLYDFWDIVDTVYSKVLAKEYIKYNIPYSKDVRPYDVLMYIEAHGRCRFAKSNKRYLDGCGYIYEEPYIKNIDKIINTPELQAFINNITTSKAALREFLFNDKSYITVD